MGKRGAITSIHFVSMAWIVGQEVAQVKGKTNTAVGLVDWLIRINTNSLALQEIYTRGSNQNSLPGPIRNFRIGASCNASADGPGQLSREAHVILSR